MSPLAAARWVDENLDLAEIAGKLFEKFGPAARPAALLALTPFELLAMFTRPKEGAPRDRVADLHRLNHETRAPKGLPPSVPSWLPPRPTRAG